MDDGQYDSPDGAPAPVTADQWNARSERRSPHRRTALVLSGGIAKGVYEAGAVRSLMAQGFEFDVIVGTSIGALNAAVLAQENPDVLEGIWLTVATKGITKLTPQAALLYDIYTTYKSSAWLPVKAARIIWDAVRAWGGGSLLGFSGAFDPAGAQSVLRILDLPKIKTPFMCASTNVDTGRAEAFYAAPAGAPAPDFDPSSQVPVNPLHAANPDHVRLYPEVVRASGALPGGFAPVALPGFGFPSAAAGQPYRYADGGVANNTPVRLARKLGVTDAICVFLSTGTEVAPRADNLLIGIENLYTANQIQLLDDELALAIATRNSLKRNEANAADPTIGAANRLVNIYQVRPTTPIAVTDLGFDDARALEAGLRQGRADGALPPAPYKPPRSYPLL